MVELISVHIKKTAGVSFHTALQHVYLDVVSAYDYLEGNLRPETDTLLYTDYEARKRSWDEAMSRVGPEVRVLADHVPAQLYDGLFPEARRVVWLRDPVERVISNYLHHLNQGWTWDIGEYIVGESARDVMTFFTAGGDLDRFFFVGIVERFKRDLALLAELLGWPSGYPVVHANKNKDPALKARLLADSALVAEIRKLNRQDIELYQRAIRKERGHGQGLGPGSSKGAVR